MNKVPKLEHIEKAIEYMGAPVGCNPALWFIGVNARINQFVLSEQQESEYITAAQARELGAGNAEWRHKTYRPKWVLCNEHCPYKSVIDGIHVQYRAIKQAQPEPVDPHTALRAEYDKQPIWTGSREDVIALLKKMELL
jgi:hypothetical protein